MTSRRIALALLLSAAPAGAQNFDLSASTFVGGTGDDAIRGLRVLADGTIVAVGSLAPGVPAGVTPTFVNGAPPESRGAAVRFSPDGRRVLSVTRFGSDAWDLAADARDNLYIAAGADGVIVLRSDARTLVYALTPGHVRRVDAAPDGWLAALAPSNVPAADATPGVGRITVFDPQGIDQVAFAGYRNTLDIALDPASRTVVLIGWRQATAWDGTRNEPVQIAYLRGVSYEGEVRWTDYDWSAERDAPDFINRSTNNMADTRGLRVAMGRDGRLYAAFECAGGNHIFRYAPRDLARSVDIVGGDAFHTFSNTRAEHKTFFARYNPADGAYLLGQQFVGRLMSGAGNTVRVAEGAIAADEAGRVYLAGASASGLPTTFLPPMTGSYTGGAHLIVMSPDFRSRLYVTRLDPGGHAHAVDARTIGAAPFVALGGRTSMGGMEFYRSEAIQPANGGGRDGFVASFNGVGSEPLPVRDAGAVPVGDAGAVLVGDAATPPAAVPAAGCACGVARTPPTGSLALLGVAAVAAMRRRRRSARGDVQRMPKVTVYA